MLTGHDIRAAVGAGDVQIHPCDEDQIAQASCDLHLFGTLAVYQGTYKPNTRLEYVSHHGLERHRVVIAECPVLPKKKWRALDALDLVAPSAVDTFAIPESGLVLMPGVLYLGATVETVWSRCYAGIVAGKSSTARKGLKVEAAGLVEPGFRGQVTLEIEVTVPLRVYVGSPVAQIRYHALTGKVESYADRGTYTGEHATGPVASRSHLHTRRHVKDTGR